MLTKQYVGDSNLPDAAHRYSPGHVAGIEKTVIRGRPDSEKNQHVVFRAFQSVEPDADAPVHSTDERIFKEAGQSPRGSRASLCALQSGSDSKTLRCTPSMAAGVSDQLWSMEELIETVIN